MDKSILIALIPALSLIIVQIIISAKQQRLTDVKIEYAIKSNEEHIERVEKQITRLEEKQDKHNNLIERVAIIERDIKTAFNRLDEFKDDLKTK